MALNLPTYIPFAEAVARYQVPAETLTRAVESGMIRAVQINGEVAVADEDVAVVAAQVQAQSEGDELVSLSEAARRLGMNSGILTRWEMYGWLPAVTNGPRRAKFVSWQRAQALAHLYRERTRRGSRLIPKGKEFSEALTT